MKQDHNTIALFYVRQVKMKTLVIDQVGQQELMELGPFCSDASILEQSVFFL